MCFSNSPSNFLHLLQWCHKFPQQQQRTAKWTLQKINPSPFFSCGLPHAQGAFSCWKDKDRYIFTLKSCVEKQKSAHSASRRSTDVIPARLTAKWTPECAALWWVGVDDGLVQWSLCNPLHITSYEEKCTSKSRNGKIWWNCRIMVFLVVYVIIYLK